MQQINSSLQYSETALSQRGTADMAHTSNKHAYETYKFPYTPKERERKLTVAARTQRTPEAIRQRQIDSAVENARNQFHQQQKQEAQPQLTQEQISMWSQWVLQADQNLEYWRTIETGERNDYELAA